VRGYSAWLKSVVEVRGWSPWLKFVVEVRGWVSKTGSIECHLPHQSPGHHGHRHLLVFWCRPGSDQYLHYFQILNPNEQHKSHHLLVHCRAWHKMCTEKMSGQQRKMQCRHYLHESLVLSLKSTKNVMIILLHAILNPQLNFIIMQLLLFIRNLFAIRYRYTIMYGTSVSIVHRFYSTNRARKRNCSICCSTSFNC
jgi:hypothetical protein